MIRTAAHILPLLLMLIIVCEIRILAEEPEASADRAQAMRDRYERIVLQRPQHGTALEKLYLLHVEAGSLNIWVEELRRRIEEEPDHANAALLHALVLESRGDILGAREGFLRAIDLDPENWYGDYALGKLALYQTDYATSIIHLNAAAEKTREREQLMEIYKALGRAQALNNQAGEAAKTWSRLADLNPNDAVTLEELAELLFEEEQFEQADKYFVRLTSLPNQPDYKKVIYIMRRASILARQGDFSGAAGMYAGALDRVGPDSWLYREICTQIEQAYRKRQDLTGLKEHYEAWIEVHPVEVDARLLLADVLAELGKDDDALNTLKLALAAAPSRDDIRVKLASELGGRKQFDEAISTLEPLRKKFPKDPAYCEQVGMLWARHVEAPDHRRRGAELLQEIAAMDGESASYAVRSAEALAAADLQEEALTMYEEAVRRDPAPPEYHEYLGEYLLTLNRRDDALAAFQQMASGVRRSGTSAIRLAELLFYHKFIEEAVRAGEEAARLEPQRFDVGNSYARLLARAGRDDQALEELERIEPLAPNTFFADDIVNHRIRLLARIKKLEEYYDSLCDRMEEKTQPDADAVLLLAKVAFALRKQEDALSWIAQALSLETHSIRVLEVAERVYGRLQDFERQIEILDKLAELAPQRRTDFLTRKAKTFMLLDSYESATSAAEQVIEAAPGNPDGYKLMASFQRQAGYVDEAFKTLKKAVRTSTRDLSLRIELANAYADAGRSREAMDSYWQAFDLAEDTGRRLAVIRPLAELYSTEGQFDQLLDRVRRFRRRTRDDLTAALLLSECYQVVDEPASARRELIDALAARPDDPNLLKKLVVLARDDDVLDDALEYQRKLVLIQPEGGNFRVLGDLYVQLDQKEDALSAWRTWHEKRLAAAADPGRIRYGWVDHLLNKEFLDEALQELKLLHRQHPDDWEPLYRMALVEVNQGDPDRARELFNDVLALPVVERIEWLDQTGTNLTQQARSVFPGHMPPEIGQINSLRTSKYQIQRASRSRGAFRYFNPPSTLEDVRNAALGYVTGLLDVNALSDEWLEEMKKLGAENDEELLVVAYLADQPDRMFDIADRLLTDDPDNHLVRMLVVMALTDRGQRRREAWDDTETEQMEAHLAYIRQNRQEYRIYFDSIYANYLAQSQQQEKLQKFVERMEIPEDADIPVLLGVLQLFNQAKRYDKIPEMIERIDAAAGSLPPSQQGWRPQSLYFQMVREVIREGELDAGLHLFTAYLDDTLPAKRRSPSQSAGTRQYRSPYSEEDFPPSTFWWEGQRLALLQIVHSTLANEGEEERLTRLFAARCESTSGPQGIADLIGMAYVNWYSDRQEEALEILDRAASMAPADDEIRLIKATALETLERFDESLDLAGSIRARYGPTFKKAQQIIMKSALETERVDQARSAALRLFSMQLSAEEYFDLSDTLADLGMAKRATVAEKKGERASARSSSVGGIRIYGGGMSTQLKDPPSRIGKPFPSLEMLNVAEKPIGGKAFLFCVWDKDQRPSRRCLTELSERIEWLADQGVVARTLHLSPLDESEIAQMKEASPAVPVSFSDKKEKTIHRVLGIRGLPWMLLTDRSHVVRAEGFDISELDIRIAQVLDPSASTTVTD